MPSLAVLGRNARLSRRYAWVRLESRRCLATNRARRPPRVPPGADHARTRRALLVRPAAVEASGRGVCRACRVPQLDRVRAARDVRPVATIPDLDLRHAPAWAAPAHQEPPARPLTSAHQRVARHLARPAHAHRASRRSRHVHRAAKTRARQTPDVQVRRQWRQQGHRCAGDRIDQGATADTVGRMRQVPAVLPRTRRGTAFNTSRCRFGSSVTQGGVHRASWATQRAASDLTHRAPALPPATTVLRMTSARRVARSARGRRIAGGSRRLTRRTAEQAVLAYDGEARRARTRYRRASAAATTSGEDLEKRETRRCRLQPAVRRLG